MNHSALKLFAMTLTAAAFAVSTAQANTSKYLGEYVPFDASAEQSEPSTGWSFAGWQGGRNGSQYLGENVPFDAAADQPQPDTGSTMVASRHNGPAAKYLGDNVQFDSTEETVMLAGLDPLETP